MNSLFSELLKKFTLSLGLDSVQFDEQGECMLRFDGILVQMYLLDDGEYLLFCSPLGNPSTERRPGLYQRMLEANCLFQETGGATLGVHPDSGQVVLSARIDSSGCNITRWEQSLENFLNIAEHWQHIIELVPDEAPVTGQLRLGEGIRV